jgi:hypothetical protein
MKSITLNVQKASDLSSVLTSFLKKFSNLEKSILIKLYGDSIVSTMSNLQKSVVKYNKTDISNVISVEGSMTDEPIYIPLIIGDKLTKVLEFFGDSELKLTIVYDFIDDKNVALSLKFKNSTLSMELPCSKISIFKLSTQITDVILDQLANTEDSIYSVGFESSTINKLKNLSTSNINDELYFNSNKEGIFFKGDNFEYRVMEGNTPTNNYGFSKNNIKNIDSEYYKMYMMDNKTIFKTEKEDTIVIISKLID